MSADLNKDEKPLKKDGAYQRFCDWVSVAMGRPLNITFWFVLIVTWTCIFAFGGPHLASGNWLPTWFTSQGYNFPLNLVTTVAELFIGFLVATAATRSQTALTNLLSHIKQGLDNDVRMEKNLTVLVTEVKDLVTEVSKLTKAIHEATVLEDTKK